MYFMANETINYYLNGGSGVKVVSLDATKAFDKLWRGGLFYKLYGKINKYIWRAIYNYYEKSKIIVKIDDSRSDIYKTTEGVKQGGILSPFLFNFFIDDLIKDCLCLGMSTDINKIRVSIIAYCDDILLISPTCTHMNELLEICHKFALNWKMEFNSKKSQYADFGCHIPDRGVYMNSEIIPLVESFIYLGLPIGDYAFKLQFFDEKFKKAERCFYSLYNLGCKPFALNPVTISFIYKQYCQSIFKYGMEYIYLRDKDLNIYNIRQNILIKRAIGLNKYCKTTPLMNSLKIESIKEVHHKHKVYLYKQITLNELTRDIFRSIKYLYEQKFVKNSYDTSIKQIELTSKFINSRDCTVNIVITLREINFQIKCDNKGLIDSVVYNNKYS